MSYSYDAMFHPHDLKRKIRFMTEAEVRELDKEIRNDSYLKSMHRHSWEMILDEVARVRTEQKQNELRDVMITFFRTNANFSKSVDSIAPKLLDAIERAGGSLSSSVSEIAAILQEVRSDVSQSDLPRLVAELYEALEVRNSHRRLR